MDFYENKNLYRSLSYPDVSPSTGNYSKGKVYLRETEIYDGINFKRQISREIIYDKTTGYTRSVIEIFDSPLRGNEFNEKYLPQPTISKDTNDGPSNLNNSRINKGSPMEIEECEVTSNSFYNKSEISKSVPETLNYKKKQLEECLKKGTQVRTQLATKNFNKFYIFTAIFAALFAYFSYILVYNRKDFPSCYNVTVQVQNIKRDLLQNVIAQRNAVNIVISSLENMNDWKHHTKVLPFVGSTGVGKTFIASLIKSHFDDHSVHSLKKARIKTFQHTDLNPTCCNLIIIDDLSASDIEKVIAFAETLPKTVNILAIPIFNIQGKVDNLSRDLNWDALNSIRDKFEVSHLYYELVTFDFFTKDDVVKWLSMKLEKHDFDVSKKNNIVKKLLQETDFIFKGLKGLQRDIYLEISKLS